ncbi:hypothetical protein DFA_06469 [Cavenderia fasciculata]|uniref:Ankyrin repeat-containing protein n=1 Tax=Cavenderia fasciculata TaxID=261658 RepID=F4PJ33_CACFS|nr:uncharacterized protein DFA_06469 [Cavenderia fasciculata]EGG24319.1 hypothetical protein DFA_06469 [Cavenderia fasciculata]|eukprot:XP_004362170.1 hypothetical protein DFA_06469 [Cavenderia fasciculata]
MNNNRTDTTINNNSQTTTFITIFRSILVRKTIFNQLDQLPKKTNHIGNDYVKGRELIESPLSCLVVKYALPWDFIRHYLPLKRDGDHPLRTYAINRYCQNKRATLQTLKHLIEWSPEYQNKDDRVLDMVCRNGHLDILVYLDSSLNPKAPCTTKAVTNAIDGQHLQVVEYLINHRSEGYDVTAYEKAGYRGRIDILKLLIKHHKKRGSSDMSIDKCLVKAMRQSLRHFDTFQFIYQQLSKPLNSSESVEMVSNASMCGYLNIVQFFHEKNHQFPKDAIDNAAEYNQLKIVQFLNTNRTERCTTDAIDKAALNGYLDIVKYLTENRKEGCTTEAMDKAAENGYIETVKYLMENRTEGCTNNAMHFASTFGHLDVVKYLYHHQQRRPESEIVDALESSSEHEQEKTKLTDSKIIARWYAQLMSSMSSHGDLEGIKYCYENTPFRLEPRDMGRMNLEMSRYIMIDGGMKLDENEQIDCIRSSIYGNDLELLKLFHEGCHNRSKCLDNGIDLAAENGYLSMVEYLHFNCRHGGSGPCSKVAMDRAAANGHLKIVQFLHNHRTEGCTTAAMDRASGKSHHSIVQFLHRHRTEGCTTAAMDLAVWGSHFEIVSFLHYNRTEGCNVFINDPLRKNEVDINQFLILNHIVPDQPNNTITHNNKSVWGSFVDKFLNK